jgi:hypothetical protein
MRDDSSENDARKIWQHQPTEASGMSLVLIRQRARDLHASTRRQLLGTLTAPLVTAFFYVFCIKQFPPLRPALHSLFAFALAWSVAGLFFLNRGNWSAAMPEDAGVSAGLEFCRRELERRRDYFHRVVLWGFVPVLLAIGTFIVALVIVAGRTTFPNAIPFIVLMIVWIAAYFVIKVRQERAVRREIDELNDIERENRR